MSDFDNTTTTADKLEPFKAIYEKRLTRVSVVDDRGNGLVFEAFPVGVDIDVQDDGQTLKVRVRELPATEAHAAEAKRREGWAAFFRWERKYFAAPSPSEESGE